LDWGFITSDSTDDRFRYDACSIPLELDYGETIMTADPHGMRNIPVGTPVVGFNGRPLGKVREAYPHYLLVAREGEHDDLEVPVHSIISFEEGTLRVHVTRESATEVDHEETAHRLDEGHHER
jgi:hypothetical protein